ncbi:MAG: hypothetical protein AB2A00_42000 [Myxococcota bacterium]
MSVLLMLALPLALVMLTPRTVHADEVRPAPAQAPTEKAAPAPATDRIWLAFGFPKPMKTRLHEKRWLLLGLTVLLVEVGAGLWAPLMLVGARPDVEWMLPVLVWTVVAWIGLGVAVVFAQTGFGIVVGVAINLVARWFATQVMFANLNRPDVTLEP